MPLIYELRVYRIIFEYFSWTNGIWTGFENQLNIISIIFHVIKLMNLNEYLKIARPIDCVHMKTCFVFYEPFDSESMTRMIWALALWSVGEEIQRKELFVLYIIFFSQFQYFRCIPSTPRWICRNCMNQQMNIEPCTKNFLFRQKLQQYRIILQI